MIFRDIYKLHTFFLYRSDSKLIKSFCKQSSKKHGQPSASVDLLSDQFATDIFMRHISKVRLYTNIHIEHSMFLLNIFICK